MVFFSWKGLMAMFNCDKLRQDTSALFGLQFDKDGVPAASCGGERFLYAFRQLSEAKQKPTRYAGGDKKLYK